jgi:hypothetical protein
MVGVEKWKVRCFATHQERMIAFYHRLTIIYNACHEDRIANETLTPSIPRRMWHVLRIGEEISFLNQIESD